MSPTSARPRFAARRAGAWLVTAMGLLTAALVSAGEVRIITAAEVPAEDGVIYRVAYQYDFPERKTVYIDGVGTVPASGKLSYLTSGDAIQFRESFGGQTLRSVRIEDPVQLMGGETIDLPKESDFPEAYRQGHWAGERPFGAGAISVLDRFFPSGYRAYRRADRQEFLTMFATLPPVQGGVRAQVAVLVSSAANGDPHNLTFTVQYTARERRSHTEWRKELGDRTQLAVQAYVGEVLKALETGAKER